MSRRHRLVVGVGVAIALAAAVPVVAFGIVPLFVRHTLIEPAVTVPPAAVSTSSAEPAPPAPLVLTGMLRRIDAVHYGSGTVTLTESTAGRVLRFENADIAGAPNMFVYLSDRTDGQPGKFTDLGPLKATNGSFNYPVPADLDLSTVKSVVVWCRAFTVTVTWAAISA
jgi:hypothetical protein